MGEKKHDGPAIASDANHASASPVLATLEKFSLSTSRFGTFSFSLAFAMPA